jgi:hypothetical protein
MNVDKEVQNVGQMDESECKLGKDKNLGSETCIEVIICFVHMETDPRLWYVEFGS